MGNVRFEWDSAKDKDNQKKHGVPFEVAQYAFADPKRVIAEDSDARGGGKALFLFWRDW